MESLWDEIKQFYEEEFKIPKDVIEFVACEPILRRFVSGVSNRAISYAVNENLQYVKEVIEAFFGFSGWMYDIDFNPIAIYSRSKGNFTYFEQEICGISSVSKWYDLDFIFKICTKYVKLKERCDKYYDKDFNRFT